MPHNSRKIGLDYVRAFAISCVIACHFLLHYSKMALVALPLGVLGVEVFFVLSGFLIGGIFISTLERRNRLSFPIIGRFWIRRWLRTLPLYFLFLVVFSWLDGMTVRQILQYAIFTQNLITAMPGQFNASWSLAVEEWFYLLLPLLTLLFGFFVRDRRAIFVVIVAMIIIPTALRFTIGVGKVWDSVARRMVVMRLDAIMWGVLVAMVSKRNSELFRLMQKPIVFTSGIALIIFSCTGLEFRFMGNHNFFASRFDAFILTGVSIGSAISLPRMAIFGGIKQIIDKLILKLSLWSYAMYLCHLPIMAFCSWAAKQYSWAPRGIYLGPITLILIIAASGLIYHSVELPIMRARDKWFPDKDRNSQNNHRAERGGKPTTAALQRGLCSTKS